MQDVVGSTPATPTMQQLNGKLAELKVEARALAKGLILSKPTTDARYDFVVDNGKTLQRIQVKYAGIVSAHSSGSTVVDFRNASGRKYSRDDVDLMLVYVPQIDKVLCFDPPMWVNKATITIRFAETANGQRRKIVFAMDYVW